MRRVVEPEFLDELAATDPGARGARRDLRKINAIMGNARIAARTLLGYGNCKPLASMVELGAGDGSFALAVARHLGQSTARRRMVLVDRRPCVQEHTREVFDSLSWNVEIIQADAFEWLDHGALDSADAILANLFLHHFQDAPLSALLRGAARRTRCFLACEPLRSRTALWAATMLPMIGCNRVTLHDARISVRAGFCHRELSSLWPNDHGWRLDERRAGLFTHHFAAQHA
jgi:SAM-dependent methyltransferase